VNEDLLGKCRACDHQVSRKALECPECQIHEPVTNWTYVVIHHSALVVGLIIMGVFFRQCIYPNL
jgi:predicted amidophosphoribosyltransferase